MSAPPLIKGAPGVGVIPRLLRDPLGLMTELTAAGPLIRMRVGPREMYFVNHPDLVGETLVAGGETGTEDFVKEGPYKSRLVPLVGETGLAFLDGAVWKRARRMMNPMFSRKRLEPLTEIMVATIAEHLDALEPQAASGEPIDLSLELAKLTMNVLTTTMFGYSLSPEERLQLGEDFRLSNDWINWRIWTSGSPEWLPVPHQRRGQAALRRIETLVRRLIDDRRRNPERDDLLTLLVTAEFDEDGSGFSDTEVRDQAMNLLFAGYETTSVTTSWALALLEQHPAWEERVIAEVDDVLGGRTPKFDDCLSLKVTKACWEEAMRLYPPAIINGRTAARDCSLGGYDVPAGSMVMLNVVGVHHHPEFWDDPERYDPGRWLDERATQRHKWAYYPFGVGPRTCIAANMANMEASFLLSMVVQRYRLALVAGKDIKPKVRMSVQFKDGPWMRVERRTA